MKPIKFQNVVVLTGAGISAESGIDTFRAKEGLWEKHRIEDVATPEGFRRNPDHVHRFYNERRAQHEGSALGTNPVEPNAAHRALAEFEGTFPGSFLLITQNVDALHEKAGSNHLLHMHGELLKMRCELTGEIYEWTGPCTSQSQCDCCAKPGLLRPHIVWFGEMPFHLPVIERALSNCDLFVSIGTSGNVYPAAGFFQLAMRSGARTVELNLEPSQNAEAFDQGEYGPAASIVPKYFQTLTANFSENIEKNK